MKRVRTMWSVLVVLLMAVAGNMRAETAYYVHLADGGIKAFPTKWVQGSPTTSDDGRLSLTLVDGKTMTFDADTYTGWTTDVPDLPRITSFKFNNKYNPSLHQDVEAGEEALPADTLCLTLNAIGKRLVPSFRTNGGEVTVTADGKPMVSKESSLRFDHDIAFVVTGRGNEQLTMNAAGKWSYTPLTTTLVVHTDWLTDNPKGVPRIDIRIDGGASVTSKTTYRHASFTISGNGTYDDMPATDVWIKGRGNTSWGWPKKPYRLKFDEKVKPFGLTAGRNWVLLSNYQTGSLFANALAMKSGQLVDAVACNHIVPVELYVNGQYQGNYMFTEKVGFGNNSVDGDEETGYMVELSVEYDATYKFRSVPFNLPVNIKEPNFDDWMSARRQQRMAEIESDFDRVCQAFYDNTDEVGELLDADACARFLFVNELNMNRESNHPKSTFLFKEDIGDPDSKLIFGPLWDFDWCYGYPSSYTYFDYMQYDNWVRGDWDLVGSQFFGRVKDIGIIKRYYYRVWTNFIEADGVKQLQEFVEDYYHFAQESFANDTKRWGQSVSYPKLVEKAKRWIAERANYVYQGLTPYDLTDFDTRVEGDVNGDGEVTVTDAYLTFCHVMGERTDGFDVSRADVNYDGSINMADVVCIVRRVLAREGKGNAASPLRRAVSEASLTVDDFEIGVGETATVCVGLDTSEGIHALQLDVRHPEGLCLKEVTLHPDLRDCSLSVGECEEGTVRVVVLPDGTAEDLLPSAPEWLRLTFEAVAAVPEEQRTVWLTHGRVTEADGEEKRLGSVRVAFKETTGLRPVVGALYAEGGRCLSLTTLEAQDVDVMTPAGICVRRLHLEAGTTRVDLPDGIYIVAGTKVIIRHE